MMAYFIVEDYERFESWLMDVFNDFKVFNCDGHLGNPCESVIGCG